MRFAVLCVTLLSCAFLALLGSAPTRAATQVPGSANFMVSATVSSGCWVVGNAAQTSGIGFGKLDFGSHPAIQAGNYDAAVGLAGSPAQLQCTPGSTVTMTIDGGQNAQGSQRRMRFGSHYLPYTLTTQPGGGSVVAPGVGVSVDASAGPTRVPVYGRATAPGSGLPAGQYTDTLQVVFSW